MTLFIADVSEFQHSIDWDAYGAANPAVIVRIHNSSRPDNSAKANIAGARRTCKWRGYYQYLTASADPVKAAHDMQATLGPTQPGEAMILDLEEGTGDQHARRAAWLNALQDPIEWTYSGLSFARTHLAGTGIEWLAAYGQGEPSDAHKLWQFTDARRFAGIASPCDASVYNGTLAQLQALTKTPAPTQPPSTKPPTKPSTPPIKGYTRNDVTKLQAILGVATDGLWGPNTDVHAMTFAAAARLGKASLAAVRGFQLTLHVTPDGLWGPNTDSHFSQIRQQYHR